MSLSNHAISAISAFDRDDRARSRIHGNDIVKICALSDRRQLADVPRVSRAGTHCGRRAPAQRAGDADQRGVHLRHDASQAAQRAQAGVHRGVLRSARPHLPRRPRRRLQSQPRADARRARAADSDGPRGVRSARRADPHLRALRSRRCDRDADGEGGDGRLRGRDRHRRQGLLSARPRPHPRLQPERGGHVVRRGRGQGDVRRPSGSGRRRARLDGRHHRQHQGCARDRREGRDPVDHRVRIAREPDRTRLGGEAQALPRRAARQHRQRPSEPRARADPNGRAGRVRP